MSSTVPHTTTSSSVPAGSQQGGFAAATPASDSGVSSTTSHAGSTGAGISPAVLGNSPLATSVGEREPASASSRTPLDSAIGSNVRSSTSATPSAHSATHTGADTTSADSVPAPVNIDIDGVTQRGQALLGQGQDLLEQGRQGAKELVDSKPVEDRNPAENHVSNLATGLAGVVLTAPLAAIERVSPQVSQSIDNAASTVGQQLSNLAHNAAPTAQNALEAVKSYLPASLGGGSTSTHASSTDTTTTTPSSSGPTVTERASGAASSAGQTISSTAQSAAETARSYLPESIANKLPTGAQTSTTGANTFTTGTATVESPYVARQDVKPTGTIDAASIQKFASPDAPDLSSGSRSSVGTTSGTDANRTTSTSTSLPSATSGGLSGAGASTGSSTHTGHHGSTGASTTGTSSVGGHSSSSAGTGTGVGSSFTHGPGEKENTSAATHATSAGAYDSKRGDGVFDVPSSALENSGPTRSSNATTTIGDSPGTATIHRTRHDETFDKTGSSPPLTTGSANKQDDGSKTFSVSGGNAGNLGTTAESELPASSTTSTTAQKGPFADPTSASAATERETTTIGGGASSTTSAAEEKKEGGIKAKLAKILH